MLALPSIFTNIYATWQCSSRKHGARRQEGTVTKMTNTYISMPNSSSIRSDAQVGRRRSFFLQQQPGHSTGNCAAL